MQEDPLRQFRCVQLFGLIIASFVLLLTSTSAAQISPGPLSKAHATLSGTTNCVSCHKFGGGEPVFKCLDCHTEIATRINAGRGLHAKLVKNTTGSQECVSCHSEHNGENFQLIKWQPSLQQFDHSQTGWTLEGKHLGLVCSRCHTSAHVAASEKSSIRIKDLNRTFLGLSRDCVTCHVDEHQGRLGQQCQRCHTSSSWKSVATFDHSKTRYPLTGSHIKLACEKCHVPSGPEAKPKWTGMAFDRCDSCHRDPHRESFANSTCQSCHTTAGWKSVSAKTLSSRFDHSTTKFPLVDKHTSVACSQCHTGGDFKRPVVFQKCSDCHRPDPHSGQFTLRADKGECSSCHTVKGFKPSTFGVAEHSKASYPLEGKHLSVECAKCHVPAGKATLYKIKFAQCTDCHRDVHLGQFKAPPNSNHCEKCHTVKGFQPSSFTLARHNETRFPLVGAHVATACGDCHKSGQRPGFEKTALYRFDDLACTGCHLDPHRGQFRTRMSALGGDGKELGCRACHTLETWKDVTRFDHSTTTFQLTGSHRAVACIDCHKPANLELRLLNVDFHAAPSKCEECHRDPHGYQFANATKVTPCAGCHTTNKWKPSTFDHDARTAFKLEGVHANVRCVRCHTLAKMVEGQSVLFYKPTPKDCASCHGPEIKGF